MEVSSEVKKVELSVRDLVEFAERSGDIDNRTAHTDPDAMQEGARLHRKIQKEQGAGYSAEVTLKLEKPEEYDGEQMIFAIEGRADGIFEDSFENAVAKFSKESVILKGPDSADGLFNLNTDFDINISFIDEIKTTYRDVEKQTEPVKVHLSQAKCYAYIYAGQNDLDRIGVRMSYANLEDEKKKYFY